MARIATVLANLFEDSEYTEPKKALEAAGHEVVTIGMKAGETAVSYTHLRAHET